MKVFLPCRRGSQRVPKKNVRPFGPFSGGLVELKLTQLLRVPEIDEILLSTNDEEVNRIASKFKNSKILIDKRPEYLCKSETTTDDLISYFVNLWTDEHIIWTHVTAPFFDSNDYSRAIKSYQKNIINGDHDSLFGVLKLQSFLWNDKGPLFDRRIRKWPFTQNIAPIYDVDSTIFIIQSEDAKKINDRIGKKPYKFVNNKLNSIDIDYEEDFRFAEKVWISINS